MWITWGCTINFSHQKLTLTFNEHDAPVHNWSSELTRYINEGATSMMHKFYIISNKNYGTIKNTKVYFMHIEHLEKYSVHDAHVSSHRSTCT